MSFDKRGMKVKGVLDAVFIMSDWLRIILIVLLILINYIAGYYVKRAVSKVYDITKSPEKAMDKLRIYNQYFLTVLYIITIVPFVFLIAKYFVNFGKFGRIALVMCAPFVFLMIVSIGQLLIINKTYKKIRQTTESFNEQVRSIVLTSVLVIMPIGIMIAISMLISEGSVDNETLKSIMSILTPIIVMVVFNIIISLLYPKLVKADDLKDERLIMMLNELFDRAGVKRARLYQQPTKDKKTANAIVVGFVKPKVIISDYYIENAEPNEIEAIIAHEVGHLKFHHITKRLVYIIGGMCGVYLTGLLMEWYENYSGNEINIILGLLILLVPFILYMSVGLLMLYRNQEQKADKFVIDIGISPEVMITALLKLAKLNHMTTRMKKMDERFQTHPSIAKRIKHIEKISGYEYEMLDEKNNKNNKNRRR
ncbi:MAG: M48 family metalloprotease [Firmicutes bacterium]|nr:M48 family metalloprotease [Bacillota bacterium]